MSALLPVVVFAFNRPRKLRCILEALRPQRVDRLIIFVDGPRHEEDRPLVEACRSLARQVDWAPPELHLWEDNRGLPGFIDHITLVMQAYPWAVFVEDDCLPMPGFYSFMRQALAQYRDCPKVFSIGGYQPLAAHVFGEYSFSLVSSARFSCWGWATWRDRWQAALPDIRAYAGLFDNLQQVPEIAGSDLPLVARAMATGKMPESWDIEVAVACLNQRLVHLQATRGLVRNIGLDRSGVHGSFRGIVRDWIVHNWNITKKLPVDPIWLDDVEVNLEYALQLKEFTTLSRSLSLRLIWMRIRDLLAM